MSRTTVATIHLGALRHNMARLRALAAPARIMAVVKADAYGHGLERVARVLDAEVDFFAVAMLGDGLRLRAAGHRQRIVVLSGPDRGSDVAEMRRLNLDTVIHHASQLAWLKHITPVGKSLRVWLEVDTGLHRLGFPTEQISAIHASLAGMSGIDPDIGLMTHFSQSEVFDGGDTPEQIRRFTEATRGLSGSRSLSNSAAVLGWPSARGDWVRTGGLLYGLSIMDGRSGVDRGFVPAMTLTTHLVAINQINKGERIGYNGIWRCPETMPVGVAAIGYGDGYPRSAPSGTPVLVGDQQVSLIGRVSMDLITLDLRQAPMATVGDCVTLWSPKLPVETIAACAGTISYELICGMAHRVLFVEDEGLGF